LQPKPINLQKIRGRVRILSCPIRQVGGNRKHHLHLNLRLAVSLVAIKLIREQP
jgi:hypothetical protein